MKTIVVTKRNQRGSALLITIGITFIIGISLAGYLIMAQKQNISVARSQTWNASIALSEAGVEDALAMMNRNGGNFDTLFNWTNSSALTADHWDTVAANIYHTRRYLASSNYYDAYITNLSTGTPNISSVGTVAWGYNSHVSGPEWNIAAAGVNPPPPATVSRKLEVRTRVDPLFNVAMAAVKTIDFNGKRVSTDSFDSGNSLYSDAGGLYPADINKTKAGGDVVTDDTIIGALDIGNGGIKGVAKTGPKGTVDIQNGSIGDRAWVEGGNIGIQPGHVTDDMNVLFEPVVLPIGAATWLAPSALQQNIPIGGITYTYAFTTTGDYKITTTLGGKIYVGPAAKVRLYVTGNANFNGGQDRIDLMAGGSVLKIYMGGTFSTGGSATINNYNQNAANFYLFGLSTCTDINLSGNAAFTGVIYAPQADFHLGGGGNNDYDFVGSSVTKSVQMNGHFRFHYDENLRNTGPAKGYTPTNWKEVKK